MNLTSHGIFNLVPDDEIFPVINDYEPNITEMKIPAMVSSLTSSSLPMIEPTVYPVSVSQEPFYSYTTTLTLIKVEIHGCTFLIPDLSKYPFPGVHASVMMEIILKCVVIGILLIIALIGNVLIIVIVTFSKKMRTTTNYYIVNLAVADLFIACCPMWIYVTTDVAKNWIVGRFLCKFNIFVQVSAECTISFTMMAIAGDRFFAIMYPLKARVTQSKVKFVMAAVWIISIAVAVPPTMYYTYSERQWADYLEQFCEDVWPMIQLPHGGCVKGISDKIYWTSVMTFLMWIPMFMMIISYAIIIHRLHSNRVNQSGNNDMSAVQRKSAWRVVKMSFILLIVFIVCTIPFQVTTVFDNYKDLHSTLPHWFKPVYFLAINLQYSHSTFNPIVYGAMNQSFRSGFLELIGRVRGGKLGSGWESHRSGVESVRKNKSVVSNGKTNMKTSFTTLS